MSKTRSNQGIEEICWDCSNVSKTIVKRGIEGTLEYCSNGRMGVISPMFKTSLKHGIEEIWGDRSNVSTTIMKQVIEVSLGYCANGRMTIGNSDFEGEMTTSAQKWNTAEIYKRKSAGGSYTEKKHQDCGAPPHQGECWSGINPPI